MFLNTIPCATHCLSLPSCVNIVASLLGFEIYYCSKDYTSKLTNIWPYFCRYSRLLVACNYGNAFKLVQLAYRFFNGSQFTISYVKFQWAFLLLPSIRPAVERTRFFWAENGGSGQRCAAAKWKLAKNARAEHVCNTRFDDTQLNLVNFYEFLRWIKLWRAAIGRRCFGFCFSLHCVWHAFINFLFLSFLNYFFLDFFHFLLLSFKTMKKKRCGSRRLVGDSILFSFN